MNFQGTKGWIESQLETGLCILLRFDVYFILLTDVVFNGLCFCRELGSQRRFICFVPRFNRKW